MASKRIIKKYPNRRLYDTKISKYITLGDVKRLVLSGIEFSVKDVKTDEDLTRQLLLQIISEQEHDGDPMFTTQTLTQLIRFYGNAYQSAFSDYLQKSLKIFIAQQEQFQEKIQETVQTNPFSSVTKMTEQNLQMWQQVQDNFFRATGVSPKSKDEKK